ncbi:MAG: SPW repeat protein [Steroidobacteraceae bacterium]
MKPTLIGATRVSGINILLGIWLLVSPWVFGYRAIGTPA